MCDDSHGCAAAERCASDCHCEPVVTESTTTIPTSTTTLPPAECTTTGVPYEGGRHVPEGSTITYRHNPPASGPHYPVWGRFMEHTAALPRGYWVHNLEHGAVVIAYRPDAPPDVVSALRDAFRTLPTDPRCGHPRALMVADPLLAGPFAAIAANTVLRCTAVDAAAIHAFTLAYRNHALEDLCAEGSRP